MSEPSEPAPPAPEPAISERARSAPGRTRPAPSPRVRPPGRRRAATVAVVVIATACLVAAAATDANAHARRGTQARALRHARTQLRTTDHRLAGLRSALAETTAYRGAVAGQDTSTRAQLGLTQVALSTTSAAVFLEGLGIGAVETCLGGVDGAYSRIAAGDPNGAAQSVSSVSGACLSLDGPANGGLVYPFDFPDPDVVLVGTTYYAYATNSVGGDIQVITSTDHVHWTALGSALPTPPSWAVPGAVWAPSVAYLAGRYVMYYTVEAGGFADGAKCISMATSAQPQGPFTDTSTAPLACQFALGGSIDPSVFVDPDGAVSLVWKSDSTSRPTALWSQPLTADGTAFAPGTTPTQLMAADERWQAGVVEGPDLVDAGGRYLLFYSGNDWNSAAYGIGVASCAGPQGPCTDLSSQPLLATSSALAGPGGPSVFPDPLGGWWLAFHAWAPGAVGYPNSRDLYVRPLDLSGATPAVGAGSG